MPTRTELLMQMLGKGVEAGSAGASEALKQRGESDKIRQQHQSDLDSQDQAIKRVKDLQEFFRGQNPHQKLNVTVSKEGAGVSDATPYDPAEALRSRGNNSAIAKANDYYMKGAAKIQDKAAAAQMGLDSVNDPKQIGSLGQARTLLLKTFNMNRYNQEEANAVLPPAIRGKFAQLFNSSGDDMNPLNESQRASLNSIFTGTLQHAKEQHEMLKQNALNTYKTSGYYDEGLGKQLEETMGKPLSQKLDESIKKYAPVPTTQTPEPSAAPLPSVMDHVKSGLNALFQPPTPQAPQAAAPQGVAPQAPIAPQGAGAPPAQAPGLPPADAIAAEIARRKKVNPALGGQ
jgi:hypothetical protein